MVEKDKIVNNINSIFSRYSGKEELEKEIDRLQSHIVELELDVRTASVRYEKSAESEKRAVAARQEAEEKLKAAEVRLKTLEHELEKQRGQGPGEFTFSRVDELSREKTLEFIRSLSSLSYTSDSLLTVYVAAGEDIGSMNDYEILAERIDNDSLALIGKITSSTGFAIFHSPDHLVNEVIVPPFPVEKSCWNTASSFDTAGLMMSMDKELKICVLVAHAGESFIGYSLDSKEFDSFLVIKSSVKAKHAKGGFSQRRFERLRDEDIAHHIDKVRSALKDMLVEFSGSIDYLFIAGDHQLAKEIMLDISPDIEQVFSSSDVRIEKHNMSGILKQLLACRRYRL